MLDLSQFTGSEELHRHSVLTRMLHTDGVHYVAETAGAYWLLDAIASWQLDPRVRPEPFQVWTLAVANGGAVLTCDDGNDNVLAKQDIEFTDFPAPGIKLFLADAVLLLPGEY